MKSIKLCNLILVLSISVISAMPSNLEQTTRSALSPDEKTQKRDLDVNSTAEMVSFDTRTPPKIKQQHAKKKAQEKIENSHAGVAIPMNDDEFGLSEATTKKLNFYKVEKPTTNSAAGLSTWILLSGQSSTTKAPLSTTLKAKTTSTTPSEQKMIAITQPSLKNNNKPLFKKKTISTTIKPQTSTIVQESKSTTLATSTTTPKKHVKDVTKPSKAKTTPLNSVKKITLSSVKKVTTEAPKKATGSSKNTTESNDLPLEAKEGDLNLIKDDTVKKNTPKKKKNKNRRRPAASDKTEKIESNTKVSKLKLQSKEKPIGTQLYNYLSREVMPTVGVGLVGLMVTAGLAGYFLYPFGAARRSYVEVDRKDKEGAYYYNDIYSGGIAEEEAIGKVIAGMPAGALQSSYKGPTSRHVFQGGNNVRYRNVDMSRYTPSSPLTSPKPHGVVQGTVETVPVKDNYAVYQTDSKYDSSAPYQSISYNQEVSDQNLNISPQSESFLDDKKFVVGNVPKHLEVVTPVAVPEHGPRSLKIRKKRENVEENEIFPKFNGYINVVLQTEQNKIMETSTNPSVVPKNGPRNLKIRRKREENEMDNEIFPTHPIKSLNIVLKNEENKTLEVTEFSTTITTTEKTTEFPTVPTTTTTKNNITEVIDQKVHSVFSLLKDLIHLKVNFGLELFKNATRSLSNYIGKVQTRVDDHYLNHTKHLHS